MEDSQVNAILAAISEQWKRIDNLSSFMLQRFDEQWKRIDDINTSLSKRIDDLACEVHEIREEFIKPLQRWERVREIQFTGIWALASMLIAVLSSVVWASIVKAYF